MISEIVKEIIEGYMHHAELADIETAEVVDVNPIKIKLSDITEPIGDEFLIIPERLLKETYEVEIPQLSFKHTCPSCSQESHNLEGKGTLAIKQVTLEVGDKVILLKAKGGQKYFVLDKVV